MTYGVRAYVVDTRRMIAAIGGKDRDLVSAIAVSCADMIEDFDYLANQDGATAYGGLLTMIACLIEGDFYRLDETDGLGAAGLGYALECLAAHLSGGPLATNAIRELTGNWLRDQPVLRDLTGRPGALAGRMPLPDDFPAICVIERQETRTMLKAVKAARDVNPDPTSRACYDEMIVWLETAEAERNGLVTFCY